MHLLVAGGLLDKLMVTIVGRRQFAHWWYKRPEIHALRAGGTINFKCFALIRPRTFLAVAMLGLEKAGS